MAPMAAHAEQVRKQQRELEQLRRQPLPQEQQQSGEQQQQQLAGMSPRAMQVPQNPYTLGMHIIEAMCCASEVVMSAGTERSEVVMSTASKIVMVEANSHFCWENH